MTEDEALSLLELEALLALLSITTATSSDEDGTLLCLIEMKLASEMDRRIAKCAPELHAGLDKNERAKLISVIEGALKTAPEEMRQSHPEDFERFRSSLAKLNSPSA